MPKFERSRAAAVPVPIAEVQGSSGSYWAPAGETRWKVSTFHGRPVPVTTSDILALPSPTLAASDACATAPRRRLVATDTVNNLVARMFDSSYWTRSLRVET